MLAQKMPLRRSLQVSTVIFTDPEFCMLIGNTVFQLMRNIVTAIYIYIYTHTHIDASLMSVSMGCNTVKSSL